MTRLISLNQYSVNICWIVEWKTVISKELNFWRALTKNRLCRLLRSGLIFRERLEIGLVMSYSCIANVPAVGLPFVMGFHPNEKTARATVRAPGLPVGSPPSKGQLETGRTDPCSWSKCHTVLWRSCWSQLLNLSHCSQSGTELIP